MTITNIATANSKFKSLGIDLNNFDKEKMIGRFKAVEVTGINVLILIYTPQAIEQLTSGLYVPQNLQKQETEYNSMVGMLLKIGVDAFTGKAFPSGPYAKVGDWVVFPRGASLQVKYEDEPLIIVEDYKVKLLVDDPSKISR